ncbi:MAG TPA: family 1 glycosylhydrolase [Terriglobales bacterium]|nr:family 1 glycosylhydrolase [Terriglobales bacterium]
MLSFPRGFLWGVSTSAHQFEGHNNRNQWATWERTGRIRSGHSSRNGCEWWREASRDLTLCRELGLKAIRISVDWGRLEPAEGTWCWDTVYRYRALLEEIHRVGMRPFITLHHFTHPQWFEERGGFNRRSSTARFARFAEFVVSQMGGLCSDWLTFNEPNVYTALGYLFGEFPPGERNQLWKYARVMTNMHRAHAVAYDRIKAVQADASVGIATNWVEFRPATPSRPDRFLAGLYDSVFNRSTLGLLGSGSMPLPLRMLASEVPEVTGKLDFVGLNVYNRLYVKMPSDAASRKTGGIFVPSDVPQGDHGCELPYGEAFPHAITSAAQAYSILKVPIYITENGVPDRSDRIRPWVIVATLRNVHALIEKGVDIRGYFHWSIVDNFEWSEGWTLRFGLYEVDPRTQDRTPRPSAELYRNIVGQNGLDDEQLSRFSDPPVPTAPVMGR